MSRTDARFRGLGFVLVSSVLAACGGQAAGDDPSPAPGSPDGGPGTLPRPEASDASPDGPARADASPGDAGDAEAPIDPGPPPVIYVNESAPNNLYRFDPVSKELTFVAAFGGVAGCNYGAVYDIAVDAEGRGFAAGQAGMFRFDPQTAQCTGSNLGSSALGLAFVRAGVGGRVSTLLGFAPFDASNPRLFAADGTGNETPIATPDSPFKSVLVQTGEGDLVGTNQGRTFAAAGSSLFEIEPTTGALVKDHGDLGVANVTGLAAWGPTLYGFTSDGTIFTVVPGAGAATRLATTNHRFRGAASTIAR